MIKFDFNNRPIKLNQNNKLVVENFEPVISVITAYYNGKKYIDETVNAILNQTYPYFEWIIVNDGSTDEESVKKFWEIYDAAGMFAEYAKNFIDETVMHRENFFTNFEKILHSKRTRNN